MHVEKLHGLTFIRPDTTANEVCLYNIEKQEDVWSANQVWTLVCRFNGSKSTQFLESFEISLSRQGYYQSQYGSVK